MPVRLDQIPSAPAAMRLDQIPESGATRLDQIPDDTGPVRLDQIPDEESSALGAFGRSAEREAIPTATGAAAFPMGFAAGTAATAPVLGPFAPVGGLVGGLAAAYGGGELGGWLQEKALARLPESVKEEIGLGEEQRQADIAKHPIATFAGGFAPQAAFLRPGMVGKLPAAIGATLGGGQEAYREMRDEGKLDPTKLAIAAGAGALLQKPTKLGTAVGYEAIQSGREHPEPSGEAVPGQKRETVTPILEEHQGNIKVRNRAINQVAVKANEKVKGDRWLDVADAIEKDDYSHLTPDEKQAADIHNEFVKEIGSEAKEVDVLGYLKDNFISHVWDLSDKNTASKVERLYPGKASISPFTRHSMKRIIETYREGIDMGLKPKVHSLGELISVYGVSMGRAIENARTIEKLKAAVSSTGDKLFPKLRSFVKQEDGSYKVFEHTKHPGMIPAEDISGMGPSFRKAFKNYAVHPDIIPALKVAFGSTDMGTAMRGLTALSYAVKRNNVGISLFHPKALLEAYVGAGGSVGFKPAVDAALARYREEGLGGVVDKVLKGGLEIKSPLEDQLGREQFRKSLDKIDDTFTKVNPALGKAIKGYKIVDQKLNDFTWSYLHTGMKLATAIRMFESMTLAHPEMAEEEIARQVSAFVNTTFGGINWEQAAYHVIDRLGTSKFADTLAKAAGETMGPKGRAILSIAFFAPDWKLSTAAAWLRAMPGAGKIVAPELAAMHRRYLLRSALMAMVISNAVNYYFTGHYMWDNKPTEKKGEKPGIMDRLYAMTLVDLGNGQHMNMFKHFMEFPHWVTHFRQQFLNAMGVMPREALTVLLNKKFLTPGYSPDIVPKNATPLQEAEAIAGHVLGGAVPITAQQMMDVGPQSALAGFLGFPMYGFTKEQRQEAARQRRLERIKRLEE